MASSSSTPAAAAVLRFEGVDKTYTMGEVAVEALRGVTLVIGAGELIVMAGPSGSGKSTILNIAGGMDRPTAGRVWHRDCELTGATERQLGAYRREVVGFVFQFYNLVPTLTARENVMVSSEIARRPLDVDKVLDRVGLADRADHFPAQLSGGEQQRVSIARALAKDPELLLCDEPTGALDFTTGKRILRLLLDLKQQLGKTVVLITHNTAIAQIADRVVHLRSGEITEVTAQPTPSPPEEVVW